MSEDSSSSKTSKKTHKEPEQIRHSLKWIIIRVVTGVLSVSLIFFSAQIIPIVLLVNLLALSGKSQTEITSLISDSLVYQFILYGAIAISLVFFTVQLLKFMQKKPLDYLMLKLKYRAEWALDVVIAYAAYFFSFFIIAGLISYFTTININQSQELGIAQSTTTIGLVFTWIMLVVFPSVSEEIVFRGFLYRWLSKVNVVAGYALTSILFGLAHLEYSNLNWIAFVDTLIFSVFLIYISQRHKSLYSAIFLHAIKNSIAFLFLFIF